MSKPFVIIGKKFNKEFRGYGPAEVDSHLQNAQKYIDELYSENLRLKETAADTQSKLEQYQQMEKTMQNTLFVAQETAGEIRLSAQKEKDMLIADAEAQARRMISAAEEKAGRRKAEIESAVHKAKEDYEQAKLKVRKIIDKARDLLETELRLLNDNELNQEVAEATETIETDMFGEEAAYEGKTDEETGGASFELLSEATPADEEKTEELVSEESPEQTEIRKRMEEVLRQSEEIREQLKKKGKPS